MAHLQAIEADVIDPFDGLVDALAIKNPAPQLLDANPEQVGVLALDLAPAGFVLGKIRIFVGFFGQIIEAAVLVLLGGFSRLFGPPHRRTPPCRTVKLAEPANVTGVLFANQIEALASEAGKARHLALPAA